MTNEKHFIKFIQILSEHDNTIEIIKDAFSELVDAYSFGEVRARYHVPASMNHPSDVDDRIDVFLERGSIDDKRIFSKEFHTGENGTATLKLIALKGARPWTDTEKLEMEIILDVFFFHFGKYRLMDIVRKSSMIDVMTGLPNSIGYFEIIKKISEDNSLSDYNAYSFNLKGFSLVNMKYGKVEADAIICRYAAVLRDFILENECVARLGGDNFVALILKERTRKFLNHISCVETYAYVGGQMITVEISAVAGVFEVDEETLVDYGQLISQSAIALNVAKHVTKKPFMFLTKEMNKRVLRQKQLRAQFKPSLVNGEFVAFYQPKVETDTYSVAGAEALVRWFSGGKMIPPGEFIPLIEEDGTVCELDFYMLGRVCHDINLWKSQGIEPVRISVNFSRKHLQNPNFP